MRRSGMMFLALVGGLTFVACDDDDDDDGASNQYSASLTGAAERPTPVTTSATGSFTLTDNGSSMTYLLTVNNLPQGVTTGGAHIHIAPPPRPAADTSGGIIVNLNPTQNVTSGTLAQGSFTAGNTISLDSVRTLLNNGRAYVNVHTPANPGGHIRGNITRN
jgi:hypothetical protein